MAEPFPEFKEKVSLEANPKIADEYVNRHHAAAKALASNLGA